MTLDVFIRYAERVRMANLAQTVNVLQAMILTRGAEMILTPTYHLFALYRVHAEAERLAVHLSGERCGSDDGQITVPALSASASRDRQGRIHLSVTNLDARNARRVRCTLAGGLVRGGAVDTGARGGVHATVITGEAVDAHNEFSRTPAVQPRPLDSISVSADNGILEMELPPRSVTLVEMDSAQTRR